MITVEELPTPFDHFDSPTTIATPTCCCCCCCCIASISTASVVAGRLVDRDVVERNDPARPRPRGLLVVVAVAAPILGLVLLLTAGPLRENESIWMVVALCAIAVGILVGVMRSVAGASDSESVATAALFAVCFPLAIVAEILLVLVTVGVFWLTIPIWIIVAVKSTAKRESPAR